MVQQPVITVHFDITTAKYTGGLASWTNIVCDACPHSNVLLIQIQGSISTLELLCHRFTQTCTSFLCSLHAAICTDGCLNGGKCVKPETCNCPTSLARQTAPNTPREFGREGTVQQRQRLVHTFSTNQMHLPQFRGNQIHGETGWIGGYVHV